MQLSKMPKYDAYKDSGIEWIGEIPENWSVNKLKYKASIDTGNSISDNKKSKYENIGQDSYPYVSTKDVNYEYSTINYNNGLAIPRAKKKFKVSRSGSTLLCIEGGSAGRKIAFNDRDICYVNKLASISPLEQNVPKFIYFLITSNAFKEQFFLSMNGLIGGVSTSVINNFVLPIPPTHEQTLIAKFLDQKTAQIDKAIEIKHKQIALLKEQKQIVINNAVTKGLNPNAPMKDSGIEWIGEIPQGWEVRRLKNTTDINAKSLQENTSKNHLIEYVDIGSVTFEDGIIHKEKYMFKDAPSRARRLVSLGDTVVSTVRTYLKAICLVDESNIDSVFSTGFATLTPKSNLDSYFLALFIKSNSFTNQVDVVSKGMSYPAINSTELSNLSIVIPSSLEQKQIVAYIDEKTNKIDKAIELQNKQIDKLKEYKASLINSVVTGKIRVTDEMMEGV